MKVINFHRITDAQWFEKTVLYLSNKYTIINSKTLLKYFNDCEYKNCNSCLITVDDGDISSYTVIYPILKKYRIPAIFFVSPLIAERKITTNFWFQEMQQYNKENIIKIIRKESEDGYNDKKSFLDNLRGLGIDKIWEIIDVYQKKYNVLPLEPQNMTIEQIIQIDKDGIVEIGAHTMMHPFLASENNERSKEEITSSISKLEHILKHPIYTFAYPNGTPISDFGEREIDILKQTSVRMAFSLEAKNVSFTNSIYAIPRYGLTHGSMAFIKIKLFLGEYYNIIKKIVK